MQNKSKGIYSRGKWIDLSEDENGHWLNIPFLISPKSNSLHCNHLCIARCETLNDVLSAASIGLLFSTYEEAESFVQNLRKWNEDLNNSAKASENDIYCRVCNHCGEVGCCGIDSFLDHHVKGKTNCLYEAEIIGEIKLMANDYYDLLAKEEEDAKKKRND